MLVDVVLLRIQGFGSREPAQLSQDELAPPKPKTPKMIARPSKISCLKAMKCVRVCWSKLHGQVTAPARERLRLERLVRENWEYADEIV